MSPSLVRRSALCSLVLLAAGCGGNTAGLLGSLTGTPTITSVTPNPATRGSTITISGLGLNGTLTRAYFNLAGIGAGGTSATASSGDTTSVTVTVPTTIAAGTYSVDVVTTDTSGEVSQSSNAVTLTIN